MRRVTHPLLSCHFALALPHRLAPPPGNRRPAQAPDDLKFVGYTDWKHLDRSNKRYFDVGVEMVLEGVDMLVSKRR